MNMQLVIEMVLKNMNEHEVADSIFEFGIISADDQCVRTSNMLGIDDKGRVVNNKYIDQVTFCNQPFFTINSVQKT